MPDATDEIEQKFQFILTEDTMNFENMIIEPNSLMVTHENKILYVFGYNELVDKLDLKELLIDA